MDVEMKVADMKQVDVEKTMKKGLHSIDGVNLIEVFTSEGIVKIDYDQEVISLDKICNIIEELGFTVDR